METYIIIFLTLIITLSVTILGFTISIKSAGNRNKNIIFITTMLISSMILAFFHVYQKNWLLLLIVLAYIFSSNPFFKELNISAKWYIWNIFFLIPLFVVIEIVAFFLLTTPYIFLFNSIFLIISLLIELISHLKTNIENSTKSILHIVLVSSGIILNLDFFLNYFPLDSSVSFWFLGYNALFISTYSYLYLKQITDLLTAKENPKQNILPLINGQNTPKNSSKYSKSSLNTETANDLVQRLLMVDKSYFLNPSLKQEDMANMLNTTKHSLSQVMNEKLNCNFTQYVNQQRLEYAETLLTKTQTDIETIAINSGFSSKVTFYRAFKIKHGISPGDFRKQTPD